VSGVPWVRLNDLTVYAFINDFVFRINERKFFVLGINVWMTGKKSQRSKESIDEDFRSFLSSKCVDCFGNDFHAFLHLGLGNCQWRSEADDVTMGWLRQKSIITQS